MKAHLIEGGIGSLGAAAFMIRDGGISTFRACHGKPSVSYGRGRKKLEPLTLKTLTAGSRATPPRSANSKTQ